MSKKKKSLLGVTLLTASMLASSAASLPSSAAESIDSYYVYDNFESDLGNWTGRGGAAVEKNRLHLRGLYMKCLQAVPIDLLKP